MSDNPSAFPTHDQTPTTDPRERILQGGMTLRDYFAGQAIVGLIMRSTYGQTTKPAEAYAIADAMLAARTGDA